MQLEAGPIVATARRLRSRVHERFPNSGISGACTEVLSIAEKTERRAEHLARPLWWLRIGVAIGVAVILVVPPVMLLFWDLPGAVKSGADVAQIIDSAFNVLLVLGGAILFLVALENRIKRRRMLTAVHELRGLAHVIDMHQLTKDPDRLRTSRQSTPSSPEPALTPAQLTRYLDYCSEMSALLGKLAALYAQRAQDAVVLGAVDAVESLTTGISRKVWQKMTILNTLMVESGEGVASHASSVGQVQQGATFDEDAP